MCVIGPRSYLILYTRPVVSHTKWLFCFSKFHKFLNQYQACLYLFKCISHCDSKYSHQILEFWHFFKCYKMFDSSSAHACRMVSVNWHESYTWFCYALVQGPVSHTRFLSVKRQLHTLFSGIHIIIALPPFLVENKYPWQYHGCSPDLQRPLQSWNFHFSP